MSEGIIHKPLYGWKGAAFAIYDTDHHSQVDDQIATDKYWYERTVGAYEINEATEITYYDMVWVTNKRDQAFTAMLKPPPEFFFQDIKELKVCFMLNELDHDVFIDTLNIAVKGKYKGFNSTSSKDVASERGIKIDAAKAEKYDSFTLQWMIEPDDSGSDADESSSASSGKSAGCWYIMDTSFHSDAVDAVTAAEKGQYFTVMTLEDSVSMAYT